jgi:hypothetical protein
MHARVSLSISSTLHECADIHVVGDARVQPQSKPFLSTPKLNTLLSCVSSMVRVLAIVRHVVRRIFEVVQGVGRTVEPFGASFES